MTEGKLPLLAEECCAQPVEALCQTSADPEPNLIQPPDYSHQSCIERLKTGHSLLRYNLSNAKHSTKHVWLSDDTSSLMWNTKSGNGPSSFVRMNQITDVMYNFVVHPNRVPQPATVPSSTSHLRFSLVVSCRTIDFEAETREVFVSTFIALCSLVYPKQKPLTCGEVLWKIFANATTPTYGKQAKPGGSSTA
eukprot:TRINITY_DN64612_c0_g2_i1.p1 TRINITY_DN64612_c0_g2~~TRINITY_DN64612_c0_g2_i1.p1  ORF type:complete len:193 (-),score=9.83 TRINITY_DN64612_c0_g2_i1:811-1389(-)